MEIQALGLGVGTAKLDEWTSLATRGLGMETVDRGGGTRAFRMDDRKQRLVLDSALPDGAQYFGWEVSDRVRSTRLPRGWRGRALPCGVSLPRSPTSALCPA